MTPVELATKVCSSTGRPTFIDGKPSDWRPITIVATMWQEAHGDPLAVGKRIRIERFGWTCALGWCQLLACWHVDRGPFPDVPRMTVADCFDIDASWDRAWLVMNRGRTGWAYNLTAWTAYTSGAYKQHVPLAFDAIQRIGLTP